MRYDLEETGRAKWLVVEIQGAAEPLLDMHIPLTSRKGPIWSLWTDEFWTAGTLPLRIAITLGAKSKLQVFSIDAELVDIQPFDSGIRVRLLLPTEEVLWVSVDERPR